MIRIGTAGWSIPREAAPAFPGSGTHLERYAAVLSAAEINSTFYRSHRPATYQRWAASVPADFAFAVKIPKAISHTARLAGAAPLLDAFVREIAGLGDALRVVLLQLPPSFAYHEPTALTFFAALRDRLSDAVEIACEPRHASWFAADAEAALADRRVARVAADPAIAPGGDRPGGWAGLRYRRLHGAPRTYYSPYDAADLAALAMSFAKEDGDQASSWCIFDNTASGAAAANAVALRSLLGSS